MNRQTVKRLLVAASVASGVAAAYLMYRRGESLFAIITRTVTNPVGALASEVGNVVQTGGATNDRNAA